MLVIFHGRGQRSAAISALLLARFSYLSLSLSLCLWTFPRLRVLSCTSTLNLINRRDVDPRRINHRGVHAYMGHINYRQRLAKVNERDRWSFIMRPGTLFREGLHTGDTFRPSELVYAGNDINGGLIRRSRPRRRGCRR